MTLQDQMKIIQAAMDGKQIQARRIWACNTDEWPVPTYIPLHYEFDFKNYEYRIYEPPKKVKMYAYIHRDANTVTFAKEIVVMEAHWIRAPWLDGEIDV